MRRQTNRFGQTNFFKLCEWMKAKSEKIAADRLRNAEIIAWVKEDMQLDPSQSTILEAKKAIGLEYAPKGKPGSNNNIKKSVTNTRMVARCLRDLMLKLGEPVPQQLADFVNNTQREPVANGIPVSSVPPAKDISVVK